MKKKSMKPKLPTIDINELRKTTRSAIAEAQNKRNEEAREAKRRQETKAKQALLKAAEVIEGVPNKVKRAALDGQNSVEIYRLSRSEWAYDGPGMPVALSKDMLRGAAAHIFEYCKEMGFTVSIPGWSDGFGIDGGYDIQVSW